MGTQELVEARKKEIVGVCEKLYQEKSFRDITIKEIGKGTSFGRTSIYNYFQTKEEIFVVLFQQEWERLESLFLEVLERHSTLGKRELADAVAGCLERCPVLLRLLSVDFYDFGKNCRQEILVEQKKSFSRAFDAMRQLLHKFCPEFSEERIEKTIYSFFPILYGIYPYSFADENTREAMIQARADFHYSSVYDIAYNALAVILGIYD